MLGGTQQISERLAEEVRVLGGVSKCERLEDPQSVVLLLMAEILHQFIGSLSRYL